MSVFGKTRCVRDNLERRPRLLQHLYGGLTTCGYPLGVSTDLAPPEFSTATYLIVGFEPAESILLQLLKAGKDAISSNSNDLGRSWACVVRWSPRPIRSIAFGTSVGIPIITNIGQRLAANHIDSLTDIFNRTCHSFLASME